MNLFGSKAILRFLREQYDYKITRRTLTRLARREERPFPLSDRIVQRRICVVASVDAVKAWAKRNILPKEPEVSRRDKVGAQGPQLP